MRKEYREPDIRVSRFESLIATAEGTGTTGVTVSAGYTAAQDLTNQFQNFMINGGTSGTVSTVKLESIMSFQ